MTDRGPIAPTPDSGIRTLCIRGQIAMFGTPTAAIPRAAVLDIDRKNGVDGLANLHARGAAPYRLSPVIPVTRGSGLHVFIRHTGPLKNSASLLVPGVDSHGDGGFIVLPPSLPALAGDECMWEGGADGFA